MVAELFSAIKEVPLLTNEVKRLASDVKEMEANQRDIDHRAVRLEAMVEIAQTQDRKDCRKRRP